MSVPVQRQIPGEGQESVWDYPRPPRVEASSKMIRVVFQGEIIAQTTRAVRVLETSHPPVYYIPQADILMDYLSPATRHTFCEFKGVASYWTVQRRDRTEVNAAWSYPTPSRGFEALKNYIAFYPGRMDACYVNDEQVKPQAGDFYGGWITSDIIGPFKGAPGTSGW